MLVTNNHHKIPRMYLRALTLREFFELELITAAKMACFIASLTCVFNHLTFDKD
jgi:hypothetical protein